ncbi:MAG: DNA primase [Clostridia bacterium]
MAYDFATWLEELKAKINIVDFIRGYIELNRKGNNYWGRCPFHHEKTASFSVNEDKQFYHCFGCGVSGDTIKFVMEMESLNFIEAVKFIADKIHVEMPEFTQKSNLSELKKSKDRLIALLKDTARYYHNNLKLPESLIAIEYLKKRKMSSSTIVRFGIGYSLGYDQVIAYLKTLGYNMQEMKDAGVIDSGEKGNYYDCMHGRLIIPIINQFGDVIGFGGRILTEAKNVGKYLNTKDTLLFNKRNELFGINNVKKFKQNNPIHHIIMVEGYMDVIALVSEGFDYTCASMGTALTEKQADLIKRFTKNVYISYDADSAGQKATMRGLDILDDAGINVKVVKLSGGKDPDEIIKTHGREAYIKLLESALPLIEYKIEKLQETYNLDVPEERSNFAIEAVNVLKERKKQSLKEVYLPLIQKISGIGYETLLQELNTQASEGNIIKDASKKQININNQAYYKAIRFILYTMFKNTNFSKLEEDLTPYLQDSEHIKIYDYYRQLLSENAEMSLSYLTEMEFKEAEEILKAKNLFDEETEEKYFNDSIIMLKLNFLNNEAKELSRLIDGETDEEKKRTYKIQYLEVNNNIKKIGGRNGRRN